MEKLKALMDFSLVKEQRQVIKDEEILVCGDEEKIPAPTGEIIVNEKRAKEIENFRHEGKALVERIKVEDSKEIEEESENVKDEEPDVKSEEEQQNDNVDKKDNEKVETAKDNSDSKEIEEAKPKKKNTKNK